MSDLDSDSHEEEYLMMTRKRRSNAGNKMKKLLEQELEEMKSKTESLNEDDLDLLFKEDAEDEDFESNKSFSETEDMLEKESTALAEDDDMVISESDEEPLEHEEEDGEKELERQEKLQRRRRKKAKPPVIKRRPTLPIENDTSLQATKKKATYELLKAESLLVSDRRTSKRSHVVANKLEVYEKLSKAEKKRKIIQERIKKNKQQQQETVLTQDDRLRMALETEKTNLLSLNKYKEQEVSKKQTRLAMQQRQKMKFKPGERILRELTTSWVVTPLMEQEDKAYWDEQVRKREKRKKKYPRRQSKKQATDPSSKDTEARIIPKEDSDEKNLNECKTVPETSLDDQRSSKASSETIPLLTSKESLISNQSKDDLVVGSEKDENMLLNASSNSEEVQKEPLEARTEFEDRSQDEKQVEECSSGELDSIKDAANANSVAVQSETNFQILDNSPDGPSAEHPSLTSMNESTTEQNVPSVKEEQGVNETTSEVGPIKEISHDQEAVNSSLGEGERSQDKEKRVSFVEQANIAILEPVADTLETHLMVENEESSTAKQSEASEPKTPGLTDDSGSEEEFLLEGPSQKVSKEFVTLYSFATDDYNTDFRSDLFGSQWSGSRNHRSTNVETICKLTMPKDLLLSNEKSPIIPDLSFLDNFPSFGEYGRKMVYDADLKTGGELEIEIKTLPPSGVFFPNGVRKKCFITNKECQYFDPKNGVPYSDVEAYKIIQELQDPVGDGTDDEPNPHFRWFGFKNGGIYLDARQKPAKGVPEGFL